MIDLAALLLSFEVALLGTAIATVVGVVIAGWLSHTRMFARALIDALVTAPLVLPPTVLGYYVLTLLGRDSVVGRVFERVTGSSLVFHVPGLVIATVLAALPLIVRTARAAFESVDARYTDAARAHGASTLRAFITVVLPLAKRGVVAGAALGFARALGDFGVTLMVAGNIPGKTRTASLSIYEAVMTGDDAMATGTAGVMAALAIALLVLSNRLSASRNVSA